MPGSHRHRGLAGNSGASRWGAKTNTAIGLQCPQRNLPDSKRRYSWSGKSLFCRARSRFWWCPASSTCARRTRRPTRYHPAVGDVLAFAGYRLLPALQDIYRGASQIRFSAPALDELSDLFSLRSQMLPPASKLLVPLRFERTIRFDHVTFAYRSAKGPAVHDVDLEIAAGTSVVFVGQTGAGKSTIVNFFLGLSRRNSVPSWLMTFHLISKTCVPGRPISATSRRRYSSPTTRLPPISLSVAADRSIWRL